MSICKQMRALAVQNDLNNIPSHIMSLISILFIIFKQLLSYTLVACICHTRFSLVRLSSVALLTNNKTYGNISTYVLVIIGLYDGLVVISSSKASSPPICRHTAEIVQVRFQITAIKRISQ
jgi:hypothetical protein